MSDTSMQDEAAAAEPAADADALLAENAALRDRLARALAESENTRRRAERSNEDMRQFAVTNFARDILPVLDNLQRALEAAEQQPQADPALLEGVRATERLLLAVLGRFGVRPIEALGTPFDPALHEAMMEVDDPAGEPGTTAGVMENGYTINDRLLRPARVTVNKRREDAAPPGSSPGGPAGADTYPRAARGRT
ncbi:MAG TPA: nucleotide exchange factor GrpE [Xanthobacteraceae bacterium]|jgi:molecular chaperone GrpE